MAILAQEPVTNVLIITALVVAVFAIMALRIMAGELEWGIRLHRLKIDAHNLRLRQYQQIAEMNQQQEVEREVQREKREQRDQKMRDVMARNGNRGFGPDEDDGQSDASEIGEAVAGVIDGKPELARAA